MLDNTLALFSMLKQSLLELISLAIRSLLVVGLIKYVFQLTLLMMK
jgi:hypothetical protein